MTTTSTATHTHDADAPPLPRGGRHLAATIAAVLLLIVSAFVAWQAILVQLHRPTTPFHTTQVTAYLGRTTWNNTAVLITGGVLALAGLWLLLTAIIPPRHKLTALREADPHTSTGIRPAHLARALDIAAAGVDGVDTAHTRLTRRTAHVTVTTPLGRPADLQEKVGAALTHRIRDLGPVTPVNVTVHLNEKAAP